MEFDSSKYRESSSAYSLPISFYKGFLQMQSRDHDFVQTLHQRSCLATMNKEQLHVFAKATKAMDNDISSHIVITGEGGSGCRDLKNIFFIFNSP